MRKGVRGKERGTPLFPAGASYLFGRVQRVLGQGSCPLDIYLEQMTPIDPRASHQLALRARLAGGQAQSLSETFWDVSGKCERPRNLTVDGRQYRNHTFDPHWGWVRPAGVGVDGEQKWQAAEGMVRGQAVHLEVRCGKCRPCLAARRREWTIRATVECGRSEVRRTWFVTLTAQPTTQLEWSAQVAQRLRAGGTDPSQLGGDEWYAERCKEAGRALTKYVKRVRKDSGAGLRCLWVFEKHGGGGPHDGLPHIHGLVHEVGPAAVNYRLLRAKWGHGFVTAKLLTDDGESDAKVASYVSKCCAYLTKATSVRIRASRGYGDPNYSLATASRPKGIGSRGEMQSSSPRGTVDAHNIREADVREPEGTPPLATSSPSMSERYGHVGRAAPNGRREGHCGVGSPPVLAEETEYFRLTRGERSAGGS